MADDVSDRDRTLETGDWRPRPDPTVLTTQQLTASIQALKELMFLRLEALKELTDEKISSLNKQIADRDVRFAQSTIDRKDEVSAALLAAKEIVLEQNRSAAMAVAKSEASTNKQIDQQGTLLNSSVAMLDGKIGDVKDRLTKLEGKEVGIKDAVATNTVANTSWQNSAALILSIFALIVMVVAAFLTKT